MEEVGLKEFLELKINDLKENIGLKLDRIEEQTTKTNGSVKDLKAWKERVGQPLDALLAERQEVKKRTLDIFFDVVSKIALGIVGAVLTIFGFNWFK